MMVKNFGSPFQAVRNLDKIFALFEARTNLEKGIPTENPNRVYRLDRMRVLCEVFGNPQDSFRSIHLAGSKGKGSTAAYIAAILSSFGRRVGVYSSPHLLNYRERFRIEGIAFPEEEAFNTAQILLQRLSEIEQELPGEGGATTFELLTLFAFLLFRNTGCDTVILETGLGGRLDATNVITSPEAVVLTPVEKEHTEILGTRLRDIASEKAGIMKKIPGRPVFSASQHFSAMRVIRKKARKTGMKLMELPFLLHRVTRSYESSDKGSQHNEKFVWKIVWKDGCQELIHLKMGGKVQAENAALALLVTRELSQKIKENPHKTLKTLAEVSLPGRFQFLQRKPVILLDGAHTPRSISSLAEAFIQITTVNKSRQRDYQARPILLFGSVQGKNHKVMARKLCGGRSPCFPEVIISTPGNFKASNPLEVAESFRKTGVDVTLIPDPGNAWKTVVERSEGIRPILITGSFFMAGEIAKLFQKDNNTEKPDNYARVLSHTHSGPLFPDTA